MQEGFITEKIQEPLVQISGPGCKLVSVKQKKQRNMCLYRNKWLKSNGSISAIIFQQLDTSVSKFMLEIPKLGYSRGLIVVGVKPTSSAQPAFGTRLSDIGD